MLIDEVVPFATLDKNWYRFQNQREEIRVGRVSRSDNEFSVIVELFQFVVLNCFNLSFEWVGEAK